VDKVMRFGQVIKISPEKIDEYACYHANAWPEVNARLKASNIGNYSIYYRDGLAFSYFEYSGNDLAGDMAAIAEDPKTQEWWSVVKPLMTPFENRKPDEFWSDMTEVYHLD
jgi:L-rhamnose mutarotase